jgi:hypothetical protein
MAVLAERAVTYARAQQVKRSGLLAEVEDGSRVDAPLVTAHDALLEDHSLILEGRTIDADVRVGRAKRPRGAGSRSQRLAAQLKSLPLPPDRCIVEVVGGLGREVPMQIQGEVWLYEAESVGKVSG